jgi:cohesin loading factor subunit SCC2
MIFRHYLPVQQHQWSPASYGTPPFAAAVMHRTLPFMSSSSSSLAFALGDPSKPSTSSVAPRPQPVYQPQESEQFFDAFIAETSQEVAQQAAPVPPSPIPPSQSFISDIKTPVKEAALIPEPPVSSPDPLAGSVGGFTTPRKRKPEELSSPLSKRIHSPLKSRDHHEWAGSSQLFSPTGATPVGSQPNKRLSVFVEVPVPPKSWSTPSTSGRSFSKSAPSTRTSDDLGGFSPPPESDWEEDHAGFRSGSKSTGKRTGDRDERGETESYSLLFSFSLVTHV